MKISVITGQAIIVMQHAANSPYSPEYSGVSAAVNVPIILKIQKGTKAGTKK